MSTVNQPHKHVSNCVQLGAAAVFMLLPAVGVVSEEGGDEEVPEESTAFETFRVEANKCLTNIHLACVFGLEFALTSITVAALLPGQ